MITATRQERRPVKEAFLVGAISFALLALLRQSTTYGDGIFYLEWAREGHLYSHHHLWLPGLVAFTRTAECLGITERTAGFLFSSFMVAVGNAALWLLLSRRLAERRHVLGLVFLASTAPVVLFFGTTAENHAQHYGWVALALLLADTAARRATIGSAAIAGLGLAAVPASHLTGFLLVFGLVLLQWCEGGRRALLRDLDARRIGRVAIYCAPLAAYVVLFHLTTWFKEDVLRLSPELLADPIRFEVEAKMLNREQGPAVWLSYLGGTWILPAFGVWALFLLAQRLLWRHDRRALGIAWAGLLPYVAVLPLYQVHERGAYFIALMPWAAWALLQTARRRWLPELLVFGCFAFGILQAAVGFVQIQRYPASEPADSPAHAQAWAHDAMRPDADAPGPTRFYFCSDLWRSMHLTYDHRAGAIDMPRWVQTFHADLPTFLQSIAIELPSRIETGPVYVTAELWEALPTLWPELRRFFEQRYEPNLVRAGRFRGYRLR